MAKIHEQKQSLTIHGHEIKPQREDSKWYTFDVQALPLKIAYFVYGLHRMSYKPFLIVFFCSIGLNKAEAGLLVGLMPLGSIVGNPFWGIIADKTKRHRTILIIQFLSAVILMCLQPIIARHLGNSERNMCPLVLPTRETATVSESWIASFNHTSLNHSSVIRPIISSASPPQRRLVDNTTNRLYKDHNRTIVVPPEDRQQEHQTLFVCLLMLIILQDFFQGSYLSFTDSAVMRYIEKQPYCMDYGLQRMASGPGAALGVPLVNLWFEVLSQFDVKLKVSCYIVMHGQYVIASFMYLAILLFLYGRITPSEQGYETLDDSAKKCEKSLENNNNNNNNNNSDASSVYKAVFRKLCEVKVAFLLVTLLLAGISLTLFSSFTMAYMSEIGASRTLLSLSYATALMSLMLGYFFSTRIIRLLRGPWNVFIVGFVAYTLRYLVYGFMNNPWLVLAVQPLHLLNRAVLNAAAVQYIKSITEPEILTSIYAVMDSIQTGVGWILGNSVGGYVYHMYGGRLMYISVACLDLIWAFFIFLFSRSRFARTQMDIHYAEKSVV